MITLDQVADAYLVAVESGEPTKAVAQSLGLTRTAAAKRVARARQAGLLPPTVKGIATSNHVARLELPTTASELQAWCADLDPSLTITPVRRLSAAGGTLVSLVAQP